MSGLICIRLGGEAVDYIRRWLGGGKLSEFLLSLPFEDGNVDTYLPEDPGRDRLVQFDTGGLMSMALKEAEIVRILQMYLKQDNRHCACFEERCLSTESPRRFLLKWGTKWFSYQTAIYHLLESSDADNVDLIQRTVVRSSAYPFLCILTSLPNGYQLTPGGAISEDTLRVFAEKAEMILLGAYDEEGVLVWRRHQDDET